MGLFDFFKKKQPSAAVAKERLQILVSHERSARGAPSWLPELKNDILEVVKKYVEVEPDAISFKVGREHNRELLELNIALPGGSTRVKVAGAVDAAGPKPAAEAAGKDAGTGAAANAPKTAPANPGASSAKGNPPGQGNQPGQGNRQGKGRGGGKAGNKAGAPKAGPASR